MSPETAVQLATLHARLDIEEEERRQQDELDKIAYDAETECLRVNNTPISVHGTGADEVREVHTADGCIGYVCAVDYPGKGNGWEARREHELGVESPYSFGFAYSAEEAARTLLG